MGFEIEAGQAMEEGGRQADRQTAGQLVTQMYKEEKKHTLEPKCFSIPSTSLQCFMLP